LRYPQAVQLDKVPGGYSEGETPGPIPNPEVKLFSADGTAREASRESRTPPEHTPRRGPTRQGRPFVVLEQRSH
jgi:hypothetical protein